MTHTADVNVEFSYRLNIQYLSQICIHTLLDNKINYIICMQHLVLHFITCSFLLFFFCFFLSRCVILHIFSLSFVSAPNIHIPIKPPGCFLQAVKSFVRLYFVAEVTACLSCLSALKIH